MALVITDEQNFTDIAGAIRTKLSVETTYLPSEMAAAIESISGGSTLGTKSITQNGTYTAMDDSLDGYSSVTVAVAGGGGAGFPASDLVGVGRAEYTPAGKNLISGSNWIQGGGPTYGAINQSLTNRISEYGYVEAGETYTLSNQDPSGEKDVAAFVCSNSEHDALVTVSWLAYGQSSSFTVPSNATSFVVTVRNHDNSTLSPEDYTTQAFQLEKGSVATSYEPYAKQGLSYTESASSLEVIHNGTVSSVDIPLPTRGWVGSLPNGVADIMTLDGQGNVAWTLNVGMTTQAVTDGITGTVGTDILSSTGVLEDGATVLYPLATATTETDTVTLPTIASGDYVQLIGLPTRQTATV